MVNVPPLTAAVTPMPTIVGGPGAVAVTSTGSAAPAPATMQLQAPSSVSFFCAFDFCHFSLSLRFFYSH